MTNLTTYRAAYDALKAAQDQLAAAEENLRNVKQAALAALPIKIGNVIPGSSNGELCRFQVDDIEVEARSYEDREFLNASFVGTKMTKSGNRHAGRHQVYEFHNFDVPAHRDTATEIGHLRAEYENGCPEEICDLVREVMHEVNGVDPDDEQIRLYLFRVRFDLKRMHHHGFFTYAGGNHVAVIYRPLGSENGTRVALITPRHYKSATAARRDRDADLIALRNQINAKAGV